jgi:hypothetical protein
MYYIIEKLKITRRKTNIKVDILTEIGVLESLVYLFTAHTNGMPSRYNACLDTSRTPKSSISCPN